jgi:hypothetical protein
MITGYYPAKVTIHRLAFPEINSTALMTATSWASVFVELLKSY